MNTQRRLLLGAGAALALPFWIARAFEEEPAPQHAAEPGPKPTTLAEAEQRARAVGKPILVIYTDPVRSPAQAGRIWGEFFIHATEETWLDLALVEVACLPRAAIRTSISADESGSIWATLIDTEIEPGPPQHVTGALTEVDDSIENDDYYRQVRARAAQLSRLVHAAILPDEAALARRRAQATSSLPAHRIGVIQGRFEAVALKEATVRLVDLDRFAALVHSENPPARLDRLALAARIRLFEQDPAGARWSTASDSCPPCGMGHVPAASRYFLRFFSK